MFSLKRITRIHASLGLFSLAFIALLVAAGGSRADELNVSCDSSFRRAMLRSAHVFTYEPARMALEHWTRLWEASSELDERTRQARRGLLLTVVDPILERAEGSECLSSIQLVRDRLESELDGFDIDQQLPAHLVCDWIVLNRLLGENHRTRAWLVDRDSRSHMRRLPKRVRDLACMELGPVSDEAADDCVCRQDRS
ncbi:MAG: hypothetical protein CMJ29_10775 [Phycisphaerae bacterium]|nr:hypothetical protein [Phycisphaerae bacterium]